IGPAVEVGVADAYGEGVAGAVVGVTLVGSGTLKGGGAVTTDGAGIATFGGLSMESAGAKQLTATSGALTHVTSASFTVSAGAAATLAFAVPPSDVVVAAAISPPVELKVSDASGDPF